MRNFFKAVALSVGVCVGLSGCGTGVTVIAMESPSISQVSPQVVTAGTPSVTVTVQGSNFSTNSALMVNGAAVPTSFVNATTLAAKISGSPLAQPNVAQLLVKNTDGAQSNQVSLTVASAPTSPQALSISTPSLPSAQVGVAYSGQFVATGGTPGYTWAITGGSLPAGMTLTSAGVLSGTPTGAGTSSFVITVTDSSSPAQQKSVALSLVVVPPVQAPAKLVANTVTLSGAQVGSPFAAALNVSGGTPGYTWSMASGSLPAGLQMSSAGVISGTPTAAGTATFTASVSDSGSPVQTASVSESITVKAAPASTLSVSGTAGAGKVGTSYSAALSATGGTPGYTWAVTSGSLPAGLTLSGGVISGTPTAAGTSAFTVTVTDSGSPVQTASVQESITVSAAASTLSVSGTTGAGKVGTSYSATLSATGGTPGYSWSVTSGSLPAGLTLSGGVISGTPTTAGTSAFTVTVTDSGSPVQTASVSESITVSAAATTLSVSGTTGAGKVGTSYSATLSATGGTSGYTWAVTSGSLPAGLTLSGGVISGTPTAAGTANFTVTVTDSGSPVQTASVQESITVSAAAATTLSIEAATLAGGQVGTQYSATLSATGGTPGYTWSVTSGSLPAGLTMSGGAISGTPTAAGTATFTVTVTDSGSPTQTASLSFSIAVSAAQTPSAGTTWYVRPDGGSRYSANYTTGQCDGKADVSYAAAVAANGGTPGTNLHCAFNDVRFLWQDGSYYGYWDYGWIISGGDTVIIRGSIADGVSYRVGLDSTTYCANGAPCFGYPGDGADSGAPTLPGGTPGQPTRILGGNYGACTAQSARTQLHGGYGVWAVLDLRGAANIDIECLDITDFSGCGSAGQNPSCGSSDDYAAYGLRLNNSINDATFTDLRLHGLSVAGSIGAVGDATTFTDVAWIGNAASGWNADDGTGTTGSGNLLVQNFEISWNGCAEEYPLVDQLPYNNCTDDDSGAHGGGPGYGDGFGTTTVTGTIPWHIKFENGVVTYNTQDGIDALHASGAGSTTTADRILAYGNMGNQIKIGSDGGSTITNNVIVSNCAAMSGAIPGTPSSYNAMLSDFCRADDEAIIVSMNDGSTSTVAGNTIYGFRAGNTVDSWGDLGGIVCTGTCTTADKIIYVDNILVGFDPYNTGSWPAQYYLQDGVFSQDPFTNAGSMYGHNIKYQVSTACPDTGESDSICAAPQVNSVAWPSYGYADVHPSSNSSNMIGAGIALPGLTQDYTGNTRGNPPSIGAYE